MDLHIPLAVKILLAVLALLSCLAIPGYLNNNALLLLIGSVSFILFLFASIRIVILLYKNIKKLQDQGYEVDKNIFKKSAKEQELLQDYLKAVSKNKKKRKKK